MSWIKRRMSELRKFGPLSKQFRLRRNAAWRAAKRWRREHR